MNPNITLKEFLDLSRSVTDNWIEANYGRWPLEEQWKKIDEEDFEFRHPKNEDNELGEFWDTFFARLVLLHLKGHQDEFIFRYGIKTLNKIYNRSTKGIRTKEDKKKIVKV